MRAVDAPRDPRLPIFAGLNLAAVLVCAGAVQSSEMMCSDVGREDTETEGAQRARGRECGSGPQRERERDREIYIEREIERERERDKGPN